jgi:hypothetical protein
MGLLWMRRARPTAFDEMTDVLGGEVARCASRAAEQAILLGSIGAEALDVTSDVFRVAGSAHLLRRAHAIRGLVLNALTALTELQNIAGRLEALAALRGAASDPDQAASARAT